jgi:hypothetical protein
MDEVFGVTVPLLFLEVFANTGQCLMMVVGAAQSICSNSVRVARHVTTSSLMLPVSLLQVANWITRLERWIIRVTNC